MVVSCSAASPLNLSLSDSSSSINSSINNSSNHINNSSSSNDDDDENDNSHVSNSNSYVGSSSDMVSRCTPYVPRTRPAPPPLRTSTPLRPFVRPFEDDFSPTTKPSLSASSSVEVSAKLSAGDEAVNSEVVDVVEPWREVNNDPTAKQPPLDFIMKGTDSSPIRLQCSSASPKPGEAVRNGGGPGPDGLPLGGEAKEILPGNRDVSHCSSLELDDRKPEDQDSDYESMASDSSSLRRESSGQQLQQQQQLLCPASGRLLLPDEAASEDSDSNLREDGTAMGREEEDEEDNSGGVPSSEEFPAGSLEDDGGSGRPPEEKTAVGLLESPQELLQGPKDGQIGKALPVTEEEVAAAASVMPGADPERVAQPDDAARLDSGLFREPGPEPTSREKLKYLRYFRLVTHSRKNDVEIAKLEKRRKRLRERSPSPIPPPGGEAAGRPPSPLLPLPSVAPHLNRLPETHAKIMYMSAIGLVRTSEEQKLVQEVIWSAVLDDRLARGDPPSTINTYFIRLRDMAGPELRGARGPPCLLGSLLPPPAETTATTTTVTGGAAVVLQQQQPPSLNIPSVHCMGLKEEVGGSLPLLLLHPVKLEAGGCGNSDLKPMLVATTNTASLPAGRIKAEPEELTTTATAGQGELRKRRWEGEPAADGQQVSPAKRRTLQQQDSGGEFAWPGLEAIEHVYKKYKADCDRELTSLEQQRQGLEAELQQKRGQIDVLSTRLAGLARLHQTLASNHQYEQAAMEALLNGLVALASLPAAAKRSD